MTTPETILEVIARDIAPPTVLRAKQEREEARHPVFRRSIRDGRLPWLYSAPGGIAWLLRAS